MNNFIAINDKSYLKIDEMLSICDIKTTSFMLEVYRNNHNLSLKNIIGLALSKICECAGVAQLKHNFVFVYTEDSFTLISLKTQPILSEILNTVPMDKQNYAWEFLWNEFCQ